MFVTNAFGQHLGGFVPNSHAASPASFWMGHGDSIFDTMISPDFSPADCLWHTHAPCCRGAAAQTRDMAYKLREIKHREAMKRQAELERREKRAKEQKRKQKTLQDTKSSRKGPLYWTILDDSPTHMTLGIQLKVAALEESNIEIKGRDTHLKISQVTRVPVYRHVRDIFGNVALERCGTKKEKIWSETLKVDPSLDVERVSAEMHGDTILIKIPYKVNDHEIRIPSNIGDQDHSVGRAEPEDPQTESQGPQNPTEEEPNDMSDGIDIQVHFNESPKKSDRNIWEELDGSIEDCDYE